MCCGPTAYHSQKHGSGCAYGSGGPGHFGLFFWSRKKKINMLEHALKCLQEQAKDIEDVLSELKEEKKIT